MNKNKTKKFQYINHNDATLAFMKEREDNTVATEYSCSTIKIWNEYNSHSNELDTRG